MFWLGMLWGLASSSVMLVLIVALHGARVEGLASHGQELAKSALAWGAAFILVGLVEEFSFRGYPLFTLTTGMGFWPSVVLLSVLFGAVHYFGKPMENWSDAVSIIFWGILWSLSLRRTGSLWFAIGFHAMSDYADMVLFAQPNTGNQGKPLHGHLLQITYSGPDWLTGGVRGSEASLLEFAILAAMFVIFLKLYPRAKFPLHENGHR
jgi:CAAX protease family protein